MNNRAHFINATEQATFISRGFRKGVRVVSRLGGPAGLVVDASSPDLLVRWEDRGVTSLISYLNCRTLAW